MSRKVLFASATLVAFSTAANAELVTLTDVRMQQTGPAATPEQRFAAVTGSGTWTWDTATNTITQTGSNTFTFGPALPASVAYVLTFTDLVITGAGATSASGFSCADGNFAATLAASICGGYDFYGNGGSDYVDDSTLIISATECTRTIGGNDSITGPTICLSNAFNGRQLMVVRDDTSAGGTVSGTLKARASDFILTAPWGNGAANYATTQPYGAPGSGWEFQFTVNTSPQVITGTAEPDNLFGTTGNDTINGLGGADTMTGLAGNDIYFVQDSDDVVVEDADEGTDVIRSSATYTLPANVENMTLLGTGNLNATGNGLANTLTGNPGNNRLDGKAGADTLKGLAGNDIYVVDNAGDVVIETANQGVDTVETTVSHVLAKNVDRLTLKGGALNINGTGNNLKNLIVGNTGNNTINGWLNQDTLTGGSGQDRFLFNSTLSSANVDTITDFSLTDDQIRLENSIFTGLPTTGTLAASAFRVGNQATTAAHRIIYVSGTGALFYDKDGTGPTAQVRFATLTPGLALTNTKFFVQ